MPKDRRKTIWTNIDEQYAKGIFILKRGELEDYTGTSKDLEKLMNYCDDNLEADYEVNEERIKELKTIFDHIINAIIPTGVNQLPDDPAQSNTSGQTNSQTESADAT